MKIFKLQKMLNKTEAGQANTNDSYVYFKSEYQSFFPNRDNEVVMFTDRKSGEIYRLHVTFGRECRLNGLGEYVRSNQLEAGDDIILERIEDNNNQNLWIINYKKKDDNMFVLEYLKRTNSFIPWDEFGFGQKMQINNTFNTSYNENTFEIKVKYNGKEKWRSDSPTEFDNYNIEGLEEIMNLQNMKSNHKILMNVLNEDNCNIIFKIINWEYQIISY